MNKREFLLASGGALLAGDVWSESRAPDSTGPAAHAVARASCRDGSLASWQKRLHDAFEVVGEHGPGFLELQRVDDCGSEASVEQFTLVFSVARGSLPSATHVLRHADHGVLALFLDHAGGDAAGRPTLRADCCRLV